jgi:glycosyltransferase involved in cell wall biosynthesis
MYFQKMTEVTCNHSPLITIITVVFNGEETIESTIKSVISFREKYKNVDYIVIDGNSTDQTVKIILKYNQEINYWISQPDKGIYDAMNKGWNVAKESLILFLGSGDEIISFPQQIPNYEGEKIIYYGKVLIGEVPYTFKFNQFIKVGNTLHHQALLIHKNSSKAEPFDINFKIYADYDFNARLFNENFSLVRLENFESFAKPGGVSSTIHIIEILTIIKNNFGVGWVLIACLYHLIQGCKYGFKKYKLK